MTNRYDIRVDATASDGTDLQTVMVPHFPEDADKIIRIREDMMTNGWQGRPVIMADAGDHHIALTGSHRIAAAMGLEDVIAAVWLPEDLTSDDWDLIEGGIDDDDLLAALEEIAEGRDDMAEIVAVMRAEVASNEEA